jgi:hypothetical protein
MERKKVDLHLIERAVLVFLHFQCVKDGLLDFEIGELQEYVGPLASNNVVELIVDELVENGSLTRTVHSNDLDEEFYFFRISTEGLSRAQSMQKSAYEKILNQIADAEAERKENETPEELGSDSKSGDETASSFDTWEPLPIEREAPEYVEAVSKSEDALKVIEGDNGYADSEPEERNHIVWAVGAGVNALKEGLITKQQVDSLLLAPLRRVVERLKKGIAVEAARAAVQAIVEWLKGLL